MPTGYTAYVQDGATFEEFVWQCARGFGAMIEMRDEPADSPVPESFAPSAYHKDKLAALEQEHSRLDAMTADEAAEAAAAEREQVVQANAARAAKCAETRQRYEAMIAQVKTWQPPSDDHSQLKEFMLDQLRESIRFDCDGVYQAELPPADGTEWLARNRERVACERAYHHKAYGEELERVNGRNEWVRKLRASVPPVCADVQP